MKTLPLILAATALLATGACTKKAATSTAAKSEPTVAVTPPADGDWSQVTTPSTAGGFIMGNPNAKVKLVEYGSMTCPHCGEFDKVGAKPLIDNYVKNGKVSWEYRNFVRDPYDLAASLVARCNGPKSFFGLTRALYAAQPEWVSKLQKVSQPQMEALQKLPPQQQFVQIGALTGFPEFAALRGVPVAKTNACLADDKEVSKLVQMNSDAVTQYNIPGTPSFLINGALLDETATWELLEPKLKTAIGS
ncbi:thioredoxin domain-containing protein [Sphingomonas sp.]|uniref:thioredoxin domain-containing protein n=1 Tax=Sphingomonas sp. TaxID=28214 RepID=UPI00286C5087|nr:thioredoxin domain-containing protein [Sphingomonas sp.]